MQPQAADAGQEASVRGLTGGDGSMVTLGLEMLELPRQQGGFLRWVVDDLGAAAELHAAV